MPNKVIPQEHRDAMVAAYLAGATAEEAAAQFGYSYMACIFALKQCGIKPRGRSEAHRRYAVDEAFFDAINTEEKAYWLGFLTADGTIRENVIMLLLQERDIGHLNKFTSSLRSKHPITRRDNTLEGEVYHCAQVSIGSTHLVTALKRLGVAERKSLTVRPCEYVPDHLLSHYWRGIFDGDGWITRKGSGLFGARQWMVGLVGNREIVSGFETFVQRCLDWKARVEPDKPGSRIFKVRYSGVALPQAVLHVLYADATIFLERKYDSMREVMHTPVQRRRR
jgi:hypothetical protein